MTLPVLVMTVGSLGGMTRYVRAAMIEALSMDYIRTARAKGLREKVVVYFPRMAQLPAAGHYRPHRLVHQHLLRFSDH